jgi:hypothetical protein
MMYHRLIAAAILKEVSVTSYKIRSYEVTKQGAMPNMNRKRSSGAYLDNLTYKRSTKQGRSLT